MFPSAEISEPAASSQTNFGFGILMDRSTNGDTFEPGKRSRAVSAGALLKAYV